MRLVESVWWMVLVRGIVLLLLGALAIAWPGITFAILAYIFALYVLVTGVINFIYGIGGIAGRRGWFLSLILGLAEMAVAIYVLRAPGLTLSVFALILGFTFIVEGIVAILVAFTNENTGARVLDVIGGILGIIAGFFILRYPATGALAFVWVVGIYGLVVGSLLIATALSVYSGEGVQRRVARR